jgi:HAMP domain-containing protein
MSETNLNPRKLFIINPSYQWRHATFTILCLLPLSALYPIVIINIFDYFIAKTAQGSTVAPEILDFRSGVMLRLVFLQISFVLLVGLVSLYLTHRTAGPLHKLLKALQEVRRGTFVGPLTFRKRDFFSELAQEFSVTFEQQAKLQKAVLAIEERVKDDASPLGKSILDIVKKAKG